MRLSRILGLCPVKAMTLVCTVAASACGSQAPSFQMRGQGDGPAKSVDAVPDQDRGWSQAGRVDQGDLTRRSSASSARGASSMPAADGRTNGGSGRSSPGASDGDAGSVRMPPSSSVPKAPLDPSLPPAVEALPLTWDLPCSSASKDDTGRLIGGGRHHLSVGQAKKLAVTFTGSVCPPVDQPRDVLFVVDVTGSMGAGSGNGFNHDPHKNGSCGRLEAIRQVIAMMPKDGSARLSLLTFNAQVVAKSSRFFDSGQALVADLEQGHGQAIDDLVCASSGDTDYAVALRGARKMFATHARAGTQKEIYFISDGLPTLNSGIKEAKELRAAGSIIASIMLIGDESVLRDQIASRDPQGQPLFRKVADASKLADALADLSMNRLSKVELRYRPLHTEGWHSADVGGRLSQYSFRLPPISFSLVDAPAYEVVLDAYDSRGSHSRIVGQVETEADR